MTKEEYHFFLHNRLKQHCILGNDYYRTNEHRVFENGHTTASGEVFGYTEITRQYYNRYRLPIMHTETNLVEGPVGDEAVHWLWKEWANVLRLRNVGIPTVGFTWYSLTDQVDWDTALREQNGNVNALGLYRSRPQHPERRPRLQEADPRLARSASGVEPVPGRPDRAAVALRHGASAREQEEEARRRLEEEEVDLGPANTSAGIRMKIGRIETFYVPPRWLFVRVESDEGAVGWGEASLEGHAEAVDGAFAALRDRFIGHDPFRIEDIWQIGYRGGFYRGGPVLMSALAGLEQALWDLKGRALSLPAWEMLGGRVRDKVRAYAWIGGDRPHEIARCGEGAQGAGLLGGQDERHRRARLDRDAEDFRRGDRARRGCAGGRAWTSASTSTGASTVRWRSSWQRRSSRSGCCSSRSRSLSENPEGLAQIANLVSTPIALGERLYSRWDFKPFFESGAVDIIQPDLSHAGGILECRKIAAMAEAYDVAVAPHCPLGPLALAACLQVAATARPTSRSRR